jgi:hypothetical protein
MECTAEKFIEDVKNHGIVVLEDHEMYRHLVLTRGSSVYRYEIITWPGYLCICGDMGTFVFSRIPDMFQFFRLTSKESKINRQYWHEKLDAVDRVDGSKKYDPDKFKSVIKEYFDEWAEDHAEDADSVWKAIEEDVLPSADDGEYCARRAARDFRCKKFEFRNFWETDLTEYTYRFIWCLYAIVYAIQKYDALYCENQCESVV